MHILMSVEHSETLILALFGNLPVHLLQSNQQPWGAMGAVEEPTLEPLH